MGNSLRRDFAVMWTKQARAHPPPTRKHTERDAWWTELQVGRRSRRRHDAPVHLSAGPRGPLRSGLGHWGAHQSTLSGTKDAHSTPHPNCKAHHQAQTPRWRGPEACASPCRWQVHGWGTCGGDPLGPQPLHLQTDTQEETAGRTGQDRREIRQTRQTAAGGHEGSPKQHSRMGGAETNGG